LFVVVGFFADFYLGSPPLDTGGYDSRLFDRPSFCDPADPSIDDGGFSAGTAAGLGFGFLVTFVAGGAMGWLLRKIRIDDRVPTPNTGYQKYQNLVET